MTRLIHGALVLLMGLVSATGCRLDPYDIGNPGGWNRGDAQTDAAGNDDAEVTPDACVATEEVCDGVDNDCDGVADNGFDLSNDRHNCGGCGIVCEFDYAIATCDASQCDIEICVPGHWNNNGDLSDGCEYACHETNDGTEVCDGVDNDCDGQIDEDFDLQSDLYNCGQCHRACSFFQGVGACVNGNCELSDCRGGFVDKDGNPDNGCECMMDLAEGTVACVEGTPGACAAGEVCADISGDGSAFCATIPLDGCDGVDADAHATAARVAFAAAARILVVWVDQRDGAGDIYLNRSDDLGATWLGGDLRLDTDTAGAGASKFPRIAADGLGGVFVAWQDLRSLMSSDIYYSHSDDNGVTWLGADMWLDNEGAVHDSYEPRVVLGRAGYVAWRDFREGLPRIRVATSSDSGVSYQTSVIASTIDTFVYKPQLTADGQGTVFVAFSADDPGTGRRDVYVNYSLNDGTHFQPADLRVDTGTAAGAADSFTVGLGAGTGTAAHVVWVDTRTGGINGDIYFNFAD